jgi:flagellar basal body P-ring protein FlgI
MDARRLPQGWLALTLLAICGCAAPALRSQSPEEITEAVESRVRLVGDYARPYGNTYIKVESVALVTGLANTGEDPPSSPQREELLHEMKTRGVNNPNQLLASPTTALVLVRAFLPPGVQKGDKLDLEVQVPSRSETTSLRGGWLMETHLYELAELGNQIHRGHKMGIGEGPVLVDPAAEGEKDRGLLVRGRVLGGGTALKSRSLGLIIAPEDKSVRLSTQIGEAINKRFHIYDHGSKQGVAKPKTDEFIELAVHPRYKHNIARYMRVVRSLPIKEAPADQLARMELLERQMLDPITASTASLRLEAIGLPAVKKLIKGSEAKEAEVRFYAAEALAYLDQTAAVAPLGRAAREEPAFRAYALAALSAMDDMTAYDELRGMLDAASAETRYGAFRALWAMNPHDSVVRGESLKGQFSYHVVSTGGPEMIHVTRSMRPEIVLFGADQRLVTPLILEAGRSILINGSDPDRVSISKFVVGQSDQKRIVSNKVDEVIRAVVELGGTYPDVVQALQQAKASKSLVGRFEVDALPDGDREYHRKEDGDRSQIEVASPASDLFSPKMQKNLH